MEEFLNQLYSYEYFGVYLVISIIVLVLLFIIILFFGKKDKKEREIEATKKLQQINNDAFKDDSIIEKVEVNEIPQESLENDTIIVPSIGEITSSVEELDEIPEPVLPVQEDIVQAPIIDVQNEIEQPVVEAPKVDDEVVQEEISPLLEKVEEKPLMFNDFNFEIENPIVNEIKIEEPLPIEPQVMEEEIEVPTFNFDEIIKGVEETKKEQTHTKGPEIFSSVYAPKKEEVELPKVEPEIKEESNDLEFELPTLKKEITEPTPVEEVNEDKIEMPVLNDYNLDNLSGEIYNINK